MRAASLVALALVAACDRPQVRVICHNANCVEPTDPEDDDTLPALQESLALQVDGRPAIDAIEIDSYWRGTDGACLFAHDLVTATNTPIVEATLDIANHIATTSELTRTGGPFRVFLELKPTTDAAEVTAHTPAQRTAHADCAWGVYSFIADTAVANGRDVELVFASFSPDLLREVIARTPASTPIPFLLDTFYGIPKPLDSATRPLSDYAGIPIDIVEVHPQWIHDAQWEGLRSQGVEIAFWMFSATVETFAAIEQYEPEWVGTSEAQLLVRWLER